MVLAFPQLAQVTPGTPITSALWMSQVYNGLLFLSEPPVLTATQATPQSIPAIAWTSLALDNTSADTYGMHSNVTNNSRATAQTPGWYLVCGSNNWTPAASGNRGIRLAKNGTAIVGSGAFRLPTGVGNTDGMGSSSLLVYLNTGDYVECQVWQNSGGPLSTVIGTDVDASLTVFWLHT